MKADNYQNEVDLADFAKNVFSFRRKLFIVLFLCVFISVVAGFVMPIPHQAWAIVKIGIIREPLLRRVDVENKLKDPRFILPILREFDRGLTDRKIKNIIVLQDLPASDEVKLLVNYPDPKAAVEICNRIAGLFVSEGSAFFIKRKNLLEEQISQLQVINRRNKDKMDSLIRQIEKQHTPMKTRRIKKKKSKKGIDVEESSSDKLVALQYEGLVLYYQDASLAVAEKIAGLKKELITHKNEYIDKDWAYYEKKRLLLTEMLSVFDDLEHYYGQRIISLSKHRAGDFLGYAQANEFMKYENNYNLYLDDIFVLKKQVLSAKDFEILAPAVFSPREVLDVTYNRVIVSGCIGFVAGLLLIFLKEYFSDEITKIYRNSFIQRRIFSYVGS